VAGFRTVTLTRGVVLAVLTLTVACSDGRTRLVVRTDFPEAVRDAAESTFEERYPDIDVRFSVADDSTSFRELMDEGGTDRFDVWWGGSAVTLDQAARSGRLSGWMPLRSTPLVIAFDRNAVAIADAPRDWRDVLHHSWMDEVVVPDPVRSEVGALLVGAIVADRTRTDGASWIGFEWLERLDGQVVSYVRDEEEALRSLRLGSASLAIVRLSTAEEATTKDDALYYRVPESGGPAQVAGAGTVGSSAVTDLGERFVEHLGGVGGRVELWPPGWTPVGDADLVDLEMVVDSLPDWLDQWSAEVRGRGM
jgi:ABC-type Fe3+ transport system substrate-binding protein